MVISPLAGFLFIDYNLTLSIVFLCALAAGIPLGAACYELVNFKLWTSFYCAAACMSAFLLRCGQMPSEAADAAAFNVSNVSASAPTDIALIFGAAFMGLLAGGLAAVLPANIIVNWFRASKTVVTGAVYTLSLLCGAGIGILMERYTYATLFAGFVIMLAGTLFFLEQPPAFLSIEPECCRERLASVRRAGTVKVFCFLFIISFALGHSIFLPPVQVPSDYFISADDVFRMGLLAGAAAAGLFSELKGIYSGCILTIFLAELSVFSSDLWNPVFQLYLSSLTGGLCLSVLPVVSIIAVYYLKGPFGYNSCVSKIFPAMPLGLAAAGTASAMSAKSSLSAQNVSIVLMIMLVISFFTIFSAWKHRLVILNRQKIW